MKMMRGRYCGEERLTSKSRASKFRSGKIDIYVKPIASRPGDYTFSVWYGKTCVNSCVLYGHGYGSDDVPMIMAYYALDMTRFELAKDPRPTDMETGLTAGDFDDLLEFDPYEQIVVRRVR